MIAPRMIPKFGSAAPWMLTFISVFFCQGALANDHYSNSAMSADIHKNCKNFSISSTGVLSADCNTYLEIATQETRSYTTRKKSIDLDHYIGNDLPNQNSLRWDDTDFSNFCSGLSINVHANGVDLSGQCHYWVFGMAEVTDSHKNINLNDGIKCDTSNGNFAGR